MVHLARRRKGQRLARPRRSAEPGIEQGRAVAFGLMRAAPGATGGIQTLPGRVYELHSDQVPAAATANPGFEKSASCEGLAVRLRLGRVACGMLLPAQIVSMDTAGWTRDLTSSVGRFRQLLRALSYFRPDAGRIVLALGLLLLGIALNLLKPWPLALLVDSILGSKPYPGWVPDQLQSWGHPAQLTAIVGAALVLHLVHATACAGHVYVSIGVGLRGLRRVRDDVFGWLQRLSLRYHHGTEAGDVIFRAGTDTSAFQILFLQGLLIFISATGTLLFMAVAMARLDLRLTAVAMVAVPILLLSIKVF